MHNLDQRIIAALSDDITEAELVVLIDDVAVALTKATADAADIIRRAMDPIDVLDANAARAMVETGNLRVDRLQNVLPRLIKRLDEIRSDEHALP